MPASSFTCISLKLCHEESTLECFVVFTQREQLMAKSNYLLKPPQIECFWGYIGITLSVRPSVCLPLCLYKILVSDKALAGVLTLYSVLILMHQQQTAFENIVGKGEIARAISPLPTMFSTQSDNCIPICTYFLRHVFICY